jgi:hypothetical protein
VTYAVSSVRIDSAHVSSVTLPNLSFNTDAQMRPLPSVAPGFVRRLPSR